MAVGPAADRSSADGSAVVGSAPDGSAPDGSAPDGSAAVGSAPDGSAAVGLVVVSHSRALAGAAVALAAEMMHGEPIPIEIAAGLDEKTFGTDAVAIAAAITAADRGVGVVVLMDLGSAVLSAELALDLLDDDELRARVVLCPAPLVEGLVAAAVAAAGGAARHEVAAEATAGLAGKESHLNPPSTRQPALAGEASPSSAGPTSAGSARAAPPDSAGATSPDSAGATSPGSAGATSPGSAGATSPGSAGTTSPRSKGAASPGSKGAALPGSAGGEPAGPVATVRVINRLGLHARPAARLVGEAQAFDARVEIRNRTAGSPWVPAASLSRVATLGALQGHELDIRATGREAEAVIDHIVALVARAFDEINAGADPQWSASGTTANTHAGTTNAGTTNAGTTNAGTTNAGTTNAGTTDVGTTDVGRTGASATDASATDEGTAGASATGASATGASATGARAASSVARSGGDRPLPGAGSPASPGIGIGPVRHLQVGPPAIRDLPSQGAGAERRRIIEALAGVRRNLDRVRAGTARDAGAEHAAIFDAHLLLLGDAEVLGEVDALIGDGSAAPRAWQAVTDRVAGEFEALPDAYLKARSADVRDVAAQVLRALLGAPAAAPPEPGVLVAADLTPGEAAVLDPARVTGVLLAFGSPTSHGAILARTRGVPAVVGLGPAILAVPDGTPVALDGGTGEVVVDPSPEVLAAFGDRAAEQSARRDRAAARAHAPAVTRDGVTVEVGANLGSVADAHAAAANGADLAGLVRTEFLFLGRDAAPGVDEQAAVYREIAAALGGRRITLRTLDVGGDKPLRYLPAAVEENPFLGVRGIRHSLSNPALFAEQLRAIVRVAHETPVSVMFPMISTVDELLSARRMLADAVSREGGEPPPGLRVGIMLEVPAAALKTAAFAPHVDFVSIGTNDLTQYALAAERGNAALTALADGLDPGVLALIDAACRGAGRATVSVCGELAADEAAVRLLTGLGVRELSVAPPAVPQLKEAVRATDLRDAAALATKALILPGAAAVRAMLA